jgi:hypothetical protein
MVTGDTGLSSNGFEVKLLLKPDKLQPINILRRTLGEGDAGWGGTPYGVPPLFFCSEPVRTDQTSSQLPNILEEASATQGPSILLRALKRTRAPLTDFGMTI